MNFCRELGIYGIEQIFCQKKMTFKAKANMFYRLKKILDYKEMGSPVFKVLFTQKRDGKKFSLGF